MAGTPTSRGVALGYLLLPLVMVVVGLLVQGERLSGLRVAAVVAAAVGVLAAVVLAGGLSWVTLVVALGYPLYFVIRRRLRLDSSGAFLLELLVLTPPSIAILAHGDASGGNPALVLRVALLGVVSAAALVLYLTASRLLPFGLFGLLTYLEPVLLVAISVVLLGERLAPADAYVYLPILIALVLLGVEPFRVSAAGPRSSPARGPGGSLPSMSARRRRRSGAVR